MDTNDRTDNQESGWQTLGELEIPVEASVDDAILTWVAEILPPLNLSTEFYSRFLRSIQTSATRALGANLSSRLTHIHLSILVPHKESSNGKPWGFFQIERIEPNLDDLDTYKRAIDFYVYIEGE